MENECYNQKEDRILLKIFHIQKRMTMYSFIANYLMKNYEARDKLVALIWVVQAYKAIDEICLKKNRLNKEFVRETFERHAPIGIVKLFLELDTSQEMRPIDDWILNLIHSGGSTNEIVKELIVGESDPCHYDFGDNAEGISL